MRGLAKQLAQMNRLINRLVSEAAVPIGEMSKRVFKKAVLFLVAMSCLFVSAIFLTIALYAFLQPLAGNAGAALSLGGLYLGAALICMLLTASERPNRARQVPAALMEDKKILPLRKAEFANNIDKSVTPILNLLQEAGRERERLALEAGAEIAKQLRPFSLVAFAIAAGLIFGRILRRAAVPGG
jgi:hypothetical protein